MVARLFCLALGVAGAAVQLDLDCAAPERSRALIEYARLSEIEQVEDIHREALARSLAKCPEGQGRPACRAAIDWEPKVAEIKTRYDKMKQDFEEKCRASTARASAADKGPSATPTQLPLGRPRPGGST